MEVLKHELLEMQKEELPIRLFLSKNNALDQGCDFHFHEQLEFYYVLSGGLNLLCNSQHNWLYPGDIGFVSWCAPHRGILFLNHTEHYIIQVDLSILSNVISRQLNIDFASLFIYNNQNFPTVFHQQKELNTLFAKMVHTYNTRPLGYELDIRSYVYQILTWILRASQDTLNLTSGHMLSSSYKDICEILGYLSNHYTENITLISLSQQFGFSISYLCKFFKKHTHTSIIQYINQLKCGRAIALIADGLDLNEISIQLGFSDYNYFSRVFKKIIGISPKEYRNNYNHHAHPYSEK